MFEGIKLKKIVLLVISIGNIPPFYFANIIRGLQRLSIENFGGKKKMYFSTQN
jgi:hypothetical protein